MNSVIRVEHNREMYFYPNASVPEALVACYADVVRNDWNLENWHSYHRFLNVGFDVPHLRDDQNFLSATSVGMAPLLSSPPDRVRLSELMFYASLEVRPLMVKLAVKPTTLAIVMFENLAMDSSAFGDRKFLAVGPTLTYKTVEEIKNQRLGDTPSRFLYPQLWAANPMIKPDNPVNAPVKA